MPAAPQPAPGRDDTWINPQIERLFGELHQLGHAHSVETRQHGHLVGGLYGVAIGGVFFGESMFSFARDASKVALVHLVARLRLGGFRLLDTQFVTAHLSQFGAEELARDDYKARLAHALAVPASFPVDPDPAELAAEIRTPGGTLMRTRAGPVRVGMRRPSSWRSARRGRPRCSPTSRCCSQATTSM